METESFERLDGYLRDGESQAALQLALEELSKTPDDWNALYLVGWVNRRLGRYWEAEKYYNKSLQAKADAYPTLLGLGITYQSMGNYEGSLNPLKRAIELNPRYVDALHSLSLSLERLNRHAEALSSYEKAASILIEEANSLAEKEGREWSAIAQTPEGQQVGVLNTGMLSRVHEILRSTVLFSIVRNNMAECLATLGHMGSAREMFEEAIEFTPDGETFDEPRISLSRLDDLL